jgi:hypothetical protein
MVLTPDQGYEGIRVQIYEPPPLPLGTLTLNPSGVAKPLPFPTSRASLAIYNKINNAMYTCRLVDIAYTFYELGIEVVRVERVARGRHVIASLEPQGVSVWGIHAWKSNKYLYSCAHPPIYLPGW